MTVSKKKSASDNARKRKAKSQVAFRKRVTAGGKRSVSQLNERKKKKITAEIVAPAPKKRRVISSISDRARRPDIHPLDRAIAELRTELAKNPQDATLLGRLGALQYRRGDLKEAENIYRRAVAIAPHRPTLLNNLGNVLCDAGRMKDGIACYEQAIALERAAEPRREPSGEALVNLELARVECKLIHERIDYLERAAQLDVSSAEAMNALGCGYLLRGKRQQALDTFRKAAQLDSRNANAALNISFTHTLNPGGPENLNAALAEIAEAILRFPKEARLHLHQGELFESTGLLEGAEERYVRALQADPRCLQAYDLLGRLREATGLSETRDDTAHAVTQTLKKLEEHAKGALQSPRRASALYDLAFVQVARARFHRLRLGDVPGIDKILREAVMEARNSMRAERGHKETEVASRAVVLRAQLLEGDGRAGEARVVLENYGAAGSVQNMQLNVERGTLALRAGEIDEATAAFDRATMASPQDAVGYHSLRFAFEGYRRYRSERVRFESAVRADARNGLAHHHMALAALSVLKDEEALFHFTRALELDPRLADASSGRGRALQRQGHLDEAEAAFEKALSIDPQNADAQRLLLSVRSRKTLINIAPKTRK